MNLHSLRKVQSRFGHVKAGLSSVRSAVRLFPETEARREGLSRPFEFRADHGGDPLVGKPVRRAGHADRADHLAGVVAYGGADAAKPFLEFLEIGGVPQLPN